eukprot:CAMPEP_0183363824 /NCGR_PEP_ID=MMETSP0164_2-20130417/76967_1 /TAXON_ID=221442 /ORGANISM="Coccolithus pelagicus ssp braarudi, Strain PLY182g" /LENGTH=73 /DNA_ID=CAMNT_0025538997 /DNA_START=233 /DNA_END=451 /DNA_ORIENTATION=+
MIDTKTQTNPNSLTPNTQKRITHAVNQFQDADIEAFLLEAQAELRAGKDKAPSVTSEDLADAAARLQGEAGDE